MSTAKYRVGDRIQGRDNCGETVEGAVESASLYSVGWYYDIRLDSEALIKIHEGSARIAGPKW